ncbi:MAG: lasso peptide biosynthesis B2 protein, partial [Anaerolineae bacterium]|nr:lasso peptide biosynthesis B2 protein [Anaerolineae bacterium]
GKGFYLKTYFLVWCIRLSLWLVPLRSLLMLIEKFWAPDGLTARRWPVPQQIGVVVEDASRHVFKATCLTQALSALILLRRYGHPATLKIGVALNEAKQFEAHAWVVSQDIIVVGGTVSEIRRFTPLPDINEKLIK